jgi:predicted DNA-binding ribbon-helix-helix protein
VRPNLATSNVRKRSVRIGQHKTSLSVEDEFWKGLKKMRRSEDCRSTAEIHKQREHANLSSVIRLFVLDHYRRLAEEAAPVGKGKR